MEGGCSIRYKGVGGAKLKKVLFTPLQAFSGFAIIWGIGASKEQAQHKDKDKERSRQNEVHGKHGGRWPHRY